MKLSHLLVSAVIMALASIAWFILGGVLIHRTESFSNNLAKEVSGVWGPPIIQQHPQAWYDTPNAPGGRAKLNPTSSKIRVQLASEPKKRGLLWYRTFQIQFEGEYQFTNPTRIPQTLYLSFPLPEDTSGLHGYRFLLSTDEQTTTPPHQAGQHSIRAVLVPPSGSVTLRTAYQTRGTDEWKYHFPNPQRISGFELELHTDFQEINFPVGTGSPSERTIDGPGYRLRWSYPDVLNAPPIGMAMPNCLNVGPVASRIAFFAPVSLCFFITVLLLIGGLRHISLHPMHVFFVACGFFAFHLLFAYLVDLIPLGPAFAVATVVSTCLVCGYLTRVGGKTLLWIAAPAQMLYLVAFSASFMIEGLTGISITILAVFTLALLMFLTANTDWKSYFSWKPKPQPSPMPQSIK